MKIILYNGPPSSGKDTSAKFLYHNYKDHHNITDFVFERFSMPLKTSFSAITNTKHNEFYDNEVYEPIKGDIIPWLGVSYRQYQINLSEKHFKPLYGEDIFGKLFLERIRQYDRDSVLVVPDSGFDIEINVLEKAINPKDVLLVRCHRKGFDFKGDSRNYVYSDKFVSLDLNNNGSKEEFERKNNEVFLSFMTGANVYQLNEEVEV